MSTQVNVIQNDNQLTVNSVYNTITVIDNNREGHIVEVIQPISNVVTINTGFAGVAGPVGPAGPTGSSIPFSNKGGDVWFTTSSIEITGSFTISGSNTFKNIGPAIFSGSISTSGSVFIDGNLVITGTASFYSSSIVYSSGSTKFGDTLDDTHQFTGSILVTGSLNSPAITGSLTGSITGSLFGTSSYSSQANTSSYIVLAQTASYVVNAISASYVNLAQTASLALGGSGSFTGSFSGTSSFSLQTITASYILPLTQSAIISGSLIITGSTNISGSFNLTGSFSSSEGLLLNTNNRFIHQRDSVGINRVLIGMNSGDNIAVTGRPGTSDIILNPTNGGIGLYVKSNGDGGIGVGSPLARWHILKTTEQLRVGYDNTNYYSTTISNVGRTVFLVTGSDAGFVFSGSIEQSGSLTITGSLKAFVTGSNFINLGNAVINGTSLGIMRVGQGTTWLDFGQQSAGVPAIWMGKTPSSTNMSLYADSTSTFINAPTSVIISIGGATKHWFNSTGLRVGSTVAAPSSTLDVAGSSSFSGSMYISGSHYQTGSLLVYATGSDKVNIGNAVVNGTSLGILRVGQGTTWLDFGQQIAGVPAIWMGKTPSSANMSMYADAASTFLNAPTNVVISIAGNSKHWFNATGLRIGSMVAAPSSTLDVAGSSSFSGSMYISGSHYQTGSLLVLVTGSDIVNIGNANTTNQRLVRIGQHTSYMDLGSFVGAEGVAAIYFNKSTPSGTNYTLAGDATFTILNAQSNLYLRVNNSDKITISTTLTDIKQNTTISGSTIITGSLNTTGSLNVTGSSKLAGKVLISNDVVTPSNLLTIGDSDSSTTQLSSAFLNIFNSSAVTNSYANIAFGQSGAGSNSFSRFGVQYIDRTGGSEDQDFFWGTVGGGVYSEKMRLTSTGNLSINRGNLLVTGSTITSGSIILTGSLDITGSALVNGNLGITRDISVGGWLYASKIYPYISTQDFYIETNTNKYIYFRPGGIESVRFSNNGASITGSLTTSGSLIVTGSIKVQNDQVPNQGVVIGSVSTTYGAIHMGVNPSDSNYILAGDIGSSFLNAGTNLYLRIGANNIVTINSNLVNITKNTLISGSLIASGSVGLIISGSTNLSGSVKISGSVDILDSFQNKYALTAKHNLGWGGIGLGFKSYAVIGTNNNDYGSVGSNYTFENGFNAYNVTDAAAQIYFSGASHVFRVANSGTSGSAITWSECAKITSTGLFIGGNINPSFKLEVSGSSKFYDNIFTTGSVNISGSTVQTGSLKVYATGSNFINLGNATPNPSSNLGILRIGQHTSVIDMGYIAGSQAAIWVQKTTPTTTNYTITADAATTIFNGVDNLIFSTAGTERFRVNRPQTSGTTSTFNWASVSDTGMTAGTNIPKYIFNGGSTQWLAGDLSSQYFFHFRGGTASFASGNNTITSSYTIYVGSPIMGTGATASANWAAGFEGNVNITAATPLLQLVSNANGIGCSFRNTAWSMNRNVNTGTIYNSSAYAYQFNHAQSADGVFDSLKLQVYTPAGGAVTSASIGVNGHGELVFIPGNTISRSSSIEYPSARFNNFTRQWLVGDLAIQRERLFAAPTYSFSNSSTITASYNIYAIAPLMSNNATASRNFAAGFSGSIEVIGDSNLTGSLLVSGSSSFNGYFQFTTGSNIITLGTHVGNSGNVAIYMNQSSPSSTNYSLVGDGSNTLLNGSAVYIRTFNSTNNAIFNNTSTIFSIAAVGSGAVIAYTFSGSTNTNQTANTEIPGVKWNSINRQWNGGDITRQREFLINGPTYSFASGNFTISSSYNLYAIAPAIGTGVTASLNYAAGFEGATQFQGDIHLNSSYKLGAGNHFGVPGNSADGTIQLYSPANGRMIFTSNFGFDFTGSRGKFDSGLNVTGSLNITGSTIITGSLLMNTSGTFVLPQTASITTPQIGSAYFTGSFLYIFDGIQYRSASLA